MATLTVTPSPAAVGDPLLISGEGFEPSTLCTVRCDEVGWSAEIMSDAAGLFGTDDIADHATALLTSTGLNPVDDDTVTVGNRTYRFENTLVQADDVKIGDHPSQTLDNLKACVNQTGIPGTDYFPTTIHPTVTAGKKTDTTILFYAKVGGTSGNLLQSTTYNRLDNSQLFFGNATFMGGTAATGVSAIIFTAQIAGTLNFSASDGINTATVSCQVFSA